MPKFNYLTPMLWTTKIPETIIFYTEVLGFDCTVEEEGWAVLERDGIEVMLAYPNPHVPFDGPLFTGSFYFNVTGVEALWDAWKDKCTICYGLEDFEYGMREFAIYDPNNYILQFGQPLITD